MPLQEIHTNPLRGIWRITEESRLMLSLLEKKERYHSFLQKITSEKRRQEWLAARLLLKALAGREESIEYRPNGAPFIAGSYNISISHTKDYVAALLQENAFAGIDIEYRSDRALRLKERFLSPEELDHLNITDMLTHTLLYWSAKEALFKMMGQENVDFREHLHIAPFRLETEGNITASETRTEKGATFQLRYQVTPFYVWVWGACRSSFAPHH